jgi:hypothetical protein
MEIRLAEERRYLLMIFAALIGHDKSAIEPLPPEGSLH